MNRFSGIRHGAGLLAVASLLTLPATAGAQQERFSFDLKGGLAVPAGTLANSMEPGASMGLGFGYWITPRFALTAGSDHDILRGKRLVDGGSREPGLNLFHFNGGAAVNLLRPTSKWRVVTSVGAGATTYDPRGDEVQQTRTRFSTTGGVQVGYRLARSADLFVGGQSYLIFTDQETQGASENWSLPISAGVKIRV